MLHPRLLSVSAAAVLSVALVGLAPSGQAQADLKVDVGTFAYDATSALMEAYVSIGAASLQYARAGDAFSADVPMTVELLPVSAAAPEGAASAPVASRDVAMRFVVPDTSGLTSSQVFVEQIRLAVQPGDYTLRLTANADTDQPEVRIERDVTVPAYSAAPGAMLSSLQLASRIEQATDPADPFAKSGVLVHPNPDARYGGERRVVPYYVEAYLPDMEGEYTFLSYIASSDRPAPIPGTQSRRTRQARPVDVIVGQVSVAELPTAVYYLRTAVLDAENSAVAETSKKIYVINPDVERPELAVAELSYEETTFGVMGDEELEDAVQNALVLANQSERNTAGALSSDEERRGWLARFWQARDNDADPFSNAAHLAHLARVSAVEGRYREGGRSRGTDTDRGRVFVQYGPPSEIERLTFEQDKAPHEIWTYDNIEGSGRSIFVFVDRFNSNVFDLLHSNVPGETSLPDWEREILIKR